MELELNSFYWLWALSQRGWRYVCQATLSLLLDKQPSEEDGARSVACVATVQGQQVHKIRADGKIFTGPWGCLTCLYSKVGNPCMLQAACPPASPVPLCGTQRRVATPLNTRYNQSQQNANRYYPTELSTTHASPLKGRRTVYQNQSQNY